MTIKKTDILILGAGPSGLFSIFQAGQLGLRCDVIDILEEPGGQCAELYPEKPIYDVPGIPHCTGSTLVQGLLAQLDRFEPSFHLGTQADSLERQIDGHWRVGTTNGTIIDARAVVVAAGAGCFTPRKLTVEGAASYEGTSLLYSVKNVDRFKGKRLMILGGGDSALDWTIALEQVASRVTLVHRRDVFRAAPESVTRMRQLAEQGRIDVRFGSISALAGNAPSLSHATLECPDGVSEQIECDVILAFFGLTNKLGPISQWGIGATEDEIVVDPVTMRTSAPGVYAVGDVASYPGKLKLILTGFNEAALMSHSVYEYLNGEKPRFQYSTHSDVLRKSDPLAPPSVAEPVVDEPVVYERLAENALCSTASSAISHIVVTDLAGKEHSLPAKPGRTLLEIMDAAKIPVKGSCYGACNCSTCHVYVDAEWFDKLDPMMDQEQEALDQVATPKPVSRLACQIEFRGDLSGLRVQLSEDTIPD